MIKAYITFWKGMKQETTEKFLSDFTDFIPLMPKGVIDISIDLYSGDNILQVIANGDSCNVAYFPQADDLQFNLVELPGDKPGIFDVPATKMFSAVKYFFESGDMNPVLDWEYLGEGSESSNELSS